MSLPTDSDGHVITSAEFGMGEFIVEVTYNTDPDGREIDPNKEDYPRTLHGPFVDEDEANAWIYAYPDGDTDIEDMVPIQLNSVRPATPAMNQHEAPRGTIATIGHRANEILIVRGEACWRYVDSGEPVSDEDFRAGWNFYTPKEGA